MYAENCTVITTVKQQTEYQQIKKAKIFTAIKTEISVKPATLLSPGM